MPSLDLQEDGLFYQGSDGEEKLVLLDFRDYYGNLGRIPLHTVGGTGNTIPNIILELNADYDRIASRTDKPVDKLAALLTAALLLRQSLGKYKPYRVLEIGCGQGILSFLLTKTARRIHEKSEVFCLSDRLYDDNFLGAVSELGGALGNLSLLTMNMASEVLRDDFFDFVLINGTQKFENPGAVARNALRVIRKGGLLLCLPQEQRILDRYFSNLFKDAEAYPVSDHNRLLARAVGARDKEALAETRAECVAERKAAELDGLRERLLPILADAGAASDERLREAVRTVSRMEDLAIELFERSDNIDLKNNLNRVKELLLNCVYSGSDAHRKACREALRAFEEARLACG